MITLSIPEASPSLNDWNYQGHWSRYLKIKRHWSVLVMVAKSQASIGPWAPLQHANVTVTRESHRNLDETNFHGGLKPLEDALKAHGLIVDDDLKHLTMTATQVKIPKGRYPRTLITIKGDG
jgi:hypothetical protein